MFLIANEKMVAICNANGNWRVAKLRLEFFDRGSVNILLLRVDKVGSSKRSGPVTASTQVVISMLLLLTPG